MQYMHNAMLGCALAVERAFSLFEQFILQATGTLCGGLYRIILNAPIRKKRLTTLVVIFDHNFDFN